MTDKTSKTPAGRGKCPGEGDAGKRAPSLREEYKQLTYERLLKAAQELFNSVGVQQTTVDDITRRAGTNRTTFYLHFRDKADLGLRLAALLNEESVDNVKALVKDGPPSRDAVGKWIDDVAEFCMRRKGEIAVASEPLDRDPKYTEVHLRQIEDAVLNGFAAYLDLFEPEQRDTIAAEIFINMIAMRRFLYISIIQGIAFSFTGTKEALVNSWVSLFERHPPPDRRADSGNPRHLS